MGDGGYPIILWIYLFPVTLVPRGFGGIREMCDSNSIQLDRIDLIPNYRVQTRCKNPLGDKFIIC